MPDDKANQEKDTAGYRALTRKCIVTGRYIRLNIWNILKFAHKGVKSYPAKLGRAGRSAFALYSALALCISCFAAPAFAADDPLAIVNNLSDFVFSLIRAVGVILLGWGVVQVGLSFQSHDPSQRSQGFLTLAGGLVITFAREILALIGVV